MIHATIEQADEIYSHFYKNKTWFPHIRKDYLKRMINSGTVVYQDGIIIVYKRYKRKNRITPLTIASKGDIMLHQILNCEQGSGKAHEILNEFFQYVNSPVWLTVREDNEVAVKFYLRNGFQLVDTTSWLDNTIPGLVFRYEA